MYCIIKLFTFKTNILLDYEKNKGFISFPVFFFPKTLFRAVNFFQVTFSQFLDQK